MTDAEALKLAIARTGITRLGVLLDPSQPEYDPRYWATVWAIVEAPSGRLPRRPPAQLESARTPPPGLILSPSLITRLRVLASPCLYAAQAGWRGCGCRGCYARGASVNPAPDVSLRECLECTAQLVRLG